jgi:hypothetical protein
MSLITRIYERVIITLTTVVDWIVLYRETPPRTIQATVEQTNSEAANPAVEGQIQGLITVFSVWFDLFRFILVQSKHQNSVFQYTSETFKTNILFQIVQKLVLVVSNRNFCSFEGHPDWAGR